MILINNLDFGYSKHKVFENLNLTFDEGKIYGLLGLNGAGKSTLLYLIGGLLFADNGKVEFNGFDMRERNPRALADLFFVPEEFELPDVKFETYIKLHAPFYPNFSRETLDRCLSGFGMDTNCRLNRLSMGQKKKAFMCFALAANTRLLIMDEPTNGLDIPSKSQFRQVVSSCMTDERTIIISTHQVRDVENLIDHITIINDKRIAFDRPVADITDRLIFADAKVGQRPENAIYAQPSPVGEQVVLPRNGEQETPLNIELLFNAVLAERERVANIFA